MSFEMDERMNERDLEPNLFATQHGRGRRRCNLGDRACELLYRFRERRALQRALPRLAPPFDRRFGESSLREMMRQQFRLGCCPGREAVAQRFGNMAVQDLPSALEEVLISCVLDEGVLETVVRFRRKTSDQRNVGISEPV